MIFKSSPGDSAPPHSTLILPLSRCANRDLDWRRDRTKVSYCSTSAGTQIPWLLARPPMLFLLHLLTTTQHKTGCDAHRAGPWRWMGIIPMGKIWEGFLAEVGSELGLDTWVITRLLFLMAPVLPTPRPYHLPANTSADGRLFSLLL